MQHCGIFVQNYILANFIFIPQFLHEVCKFWDSGIKIWTVEDFHFFNQDDQKQQRWSSYDNKKITYKIKSAQKSVLVHFKYN